MDDVPGGTDYMLSGNNILNVFNIVPVPQCFATLYQFTEGWIPYQLPRVVCNTFVQRCCSVLQCTKIVCRKIFNLWFTVISCPISICGKIINLCLANTKYLLGTLFTLVPILYYFDKSRRDPTQRSKGKNVKFYKNEQKSKPDGWYIEEMLQKLQGNNQKLEDNHGYVQWLFPNKEKGVNWQADPITDAELRDIKSDPFCRERFVRAYAMMLQFYGIDLVDREIGTLRIRQDYTERCDNLQRHTHNYLRITRIIKALGLFGFEQYQETLIYHLVDAVKTGELSEPGAERSLKKHWIPSVCNPDLRDTLMNDN